MDKNCATGAAGAGYQTYEKQILHPKAHPYYPRVLAHSLDPTPSFHLTPAATFFVDKLVRSRLRQG